MIGCFENQRALEGDSWLPKKAADKKFKIQNNLAPVFCNRFKYIQTATETRKNSDPIAPDTIGNGDKRKRT